MRSDSERKRLRRICEACPQWDRRRRGCGFIDRCKRTRLMPIFFARGSCRLNKW